MAKWIKFNNGTIVNMDNALFIDKRMDNSLEIRFDSISKIITFDNKELMERTFNKLFEMLIIN